MKVKLNGRLRVAPVWYLYDDGVVRIVTGGRKLADLRTDPYVSLSVEKADRGQPEWTVTLRGTATVIEDVEAFAEVNRRITRKYGAEENTTTTCSAENGSTSRSQSAAVIGPGSPRPFTGA